MPTWNPAQYLRFGSERTRPGLDLLAQVPVESPKLVVDLGSGPGTITAFLRSRWPSARIVGVDSSPAMLAKARTLDLDVQWVEADISTFSPEPCERPDVLYSNAALHWIDGHETLFPRLAELLAPGGALAVQMPLNFAAPSHTALAETIREGPWRSRLEPLFRGAPVLEPPRYYEILRPVASCVDVWETTYLHVLEGDDPVVEWIKGSALRPILDHLDEAETEAFLEDYRRRMRVAYPRRETGETLLTYRRVFVVAKR